MAHIEKREGRAKPWRVRYRGPDGRERSKSFTLKAEAAAFMHSTETSKQDGRWVDPRAGEKRIASWAEEVFASRLNLRPATMARDESYLRSHVLPSFGTAPLAKVSRRDVQHWVRHLSEDKGLAPRTVRECYRILAMLFSEAVESRLIPQSPCTRVALPRAARSDKRFLTAAEVERLAGAMDERYSALVYVAGYLGLRFGEIAGLKRNRLNLLRRELNIVGTLERVGNGWRYVEDTKTDAGRRLLTLPPFLVAILEKHLESAPASEYVFPAPGGGFLRYHSWRRRFWNPAVEKAGLAPLTPHELRHTAASLAIAQGANPLTVQRLLGHRQVTTTLSIYGHLYPEQDAALIAGMEKGRADALAAQPRPNVVSLNART